MENDQGAEPIARDASASGGEAVSDETKPISAFTKALFDFWRPASLVFDPKSGARAIFTITFLMHAPFAVIVLATVFLIPEVRVYLPLLLILWLGIVGYCVVELIRSVKQATLPKIAAGDPNALSEINSERSTEIKTYRFTPVGDEEVAEKERAFRIYGLELDLRKSQDANEELSQSKSDLGNELANLKFRSGLFLIAAIILGCVAIVQFDEKKRTRVALEKLTSLEIDRMEGQSIGVYSLPGVGDDVQVLSNLFVRHISNAMANAEEDEERETSERRFSSLKETKPDFEKTGLYMRFTDSQTGYEFASLSNQQDGLVWNSITPGQTLAVDVEGLQIGVSLVIEGSASSETSLRLTLLPDSDLGRLSLEELRQLRFRKELKDQD